MHIEKRFCFNNTNKLNKISPSAKTDYDQCNYHCVDNNYVLNTYFVTKMDILTITSFHIEHKNKGQNV